MPPHDFPELSARIESTLAAIRASHKMIPDTSLILGTGLGSLASAFEVEASFDYGELPYFPIPTTEDHAGKLLLGRLENRAVAIFQGRLHLYEGFTAQEVAYPIRVAKALGARNLIVTNIAGGLDPTQKLGGIMVIRDHLNLMGVNPLMGAHNDALGPRFVDMSRPYPQDFRALARRCAKEQGLDLSEGVYAAMTGPSLETAAEYRMLRILGADAIGMSTIPEVIVAVQCGLRVLGLTLISDLCDPDHLEPIDLPKLFAVVGEAEPRLARLVRAIVAAV